MITKAAVFFAVLGVLAGCSDRKEPRTLTIAYSNDMLGEIRSCGCASDDVGGLGRRATFLAQVRDTTGDFLLLEGGDFFGSGINYGKEKAELTLRSMEMMKYDGIVIGEADLGFGLDFIVDQARALKLPIVVSNLHDAEADTLVFPASREIVLPSGLRVAIIGALGARMKLPPQVGEARVKLIDAAKAVAPLVEELRERTDIVVLLAHMTQSEVQRLTGQVDGIDVVVYGHDAHPMRRIRRMNGAYPLQVSDRGRYMGVAFAVLGDDGRIKRLISNVTPLSNYYPDDEAVAKLFRSFDLNIAARETSGVPVGVLEARRGISKPFEGAQECQACHEEIYAHWEESKHAHAFQILVDAQREYDRDCTPCHTTGFYKTGGFEGFNVTPDLINIQCEACHGNGAAHVADPDVRTDTDARGTCRSCHTVDQTPEFDFDTFWARIAHPGGTAGGNKASGR
jgi:2',3'-cyclic-nucleotide 2'-phosphodiesterase (5'-nucleotidase family)